MSVQAGIAASLTRLRDPGTLIAFVLGLLFELGVALLERAHGRPGAVDRALSGGAFGIALPLFCYFAVTRACAGVSVQAATFPLARHGMNRTALIVGLTVPVVVVCGAFAVVSGACVVTLTRGFSDPAWFRDSIASVWIGGAAAIAYTALLMGASAFGRRGSGRVWCLAGDFLLGAGTSFLAMPWPKGHVRNLLGGAPVLDLAQITALGLLFGTSFAFLWLGTLRARR